MQGGKRGQMFMEHGMSCLVYNYNLDFTGGDHHVEKGCLCGRVEWIEGSSSVG